MQHLLSERVKSRVWDSGAFTGVVLGCECNVCLMSLCCAMNGFSTGKLLKVVSLTFFVSFSDFTNEEPKYAGEVSQSLQPWFLNILSPYISNVVSPSPVFASNIKLSHHIQGFSCMCVGSYVTIDNLLTVTIITPLLWVTAVRVLQHFFKFSSLWLSPIFPEMEKFRLFYSLATHTSSFFSFMQKKTEYEKSNWAR